MSWKKKKVMVRRRGGEEEEQKEDDKKRHQWKVISRMQRVFDRWGRGKRRRGRRGRRGRGKRRRGKTFLSPSNSWPCRLLWKWFVLAFGDGFDHSRGGYYPGCALLGFRRNFFQFIRHRAWPTYGYNGERNKRCNHCTHEIFKEHVNVMLIPFTILLCSSWP